MHPDFKHNGRLEQCNSDEPGGDDSGQAPTAFIQIFGWFCIFASAFFFYLATVVIRWAGEETQLAPSYFVFARFLLGFVIISILMLTLGKKPRPRRYHLLVGRTVFNCVAVYFFFKAVAVTSGAEGNILNMTYPVFLALFSWILIRQQRDPVAVIMVVLAFAGIWLILSPGGFDFRLNSLWGLASGVCASFAIIYLNLSRQYHDSETILFFMFGLGSVIMYAFFFREIFLPDAAELYYLMLCAAFGVGGQYLLTYGFRYVTAVEGGIISSTRILLAAMLGPIIAAEPPLMVTGWLGALLIFTANVVLAVRRVRQESGSR